eukprot:Plantae.Rhodophyta-Purpureofilum_apyrenoidigerum.ctg1032.p1 GENE.Plantae.Rhodophyta-Purpureofilum_apyrenoidigerum.ctg1032~~Plantae.Rhodophyta-Purpureofilum_apyrenoidigerum.ctg1032.p1  ORF type:complete len:493 (+),score=88.54 Plantae.Rhodophyta-Purpureofilum_apyrenoidigerum.ctg1032:155-1633(+)
MDRRWRLGVLVVACVWCAAECGTFRGATDEFEENVRQGGVYCPRYYSAAVRMKVTEDIVNDDYCDCEDGTDEPGTPACGISKFFCKLDGPDGKFINSSWVNDSFCDCCDGSDEYDGQIQCENRCSSNMKAQIQAYQNEIKMIERGLDAKAKLVSLGESSLREVDNEIQRVNSELSNVKTELEKVVRVKELTQKLKEEAEQSAEGAMTVSPRQSYSEDEFFDDEDDDYGENFDYDANYAVKSDPEPSVASADVSREEQASNDGPLVKSPEKTQSNSKENTSMDEVEKECQRLFDSLLESSIGATALKALSKLRLMPLLAKVLSLRNDGGGDFKLILECSKKAKDKFNRLESDKLRLEKEAKQLQERKTRTAREDAAFRGLAQDCIKSTIHQYVYELCMFDTVRQYEQGKVIGSLGKWRHWTNGKQLYDRGVSCWQGPQRSTTVDFSCGDKNTILDVQEPERCVYKMSVATPAACEHSAISKIEEIVARLSSTK